MTKPIDNEQIIAQVDRLFCHSASRYGGYRRIDEGEVVVPNTLYRFLLSDADSQFVSLQFYRGVESIGGALWTREVRALMRVSARRHPALPMILGGAYDDKEDIAFVITEAARNRLSEDGAMGFVAQDKVQVLRQLTVLTHGLSILHEQGITHRNLHPDSIEYQQHGRTPEGQAERYGLRLVRFEMSAMLSNLVRRQVAGENLPSGDLRDLYLAAADQTLAYCPPERAEWLFGSEGTGSFESDRSDVYALGVLAWRWLVEAQSSAQNSYEEDRLAWLGLERNLDAVRRLNEHLRRRLRQSGLFPHLADLLRDMLAWDPRSRPSSSEALQVLTRDYGRLAASFSPAQEYRPFYVGFMPVESRKTIFRWGWIDHDPTEDIGREQLRAYLQEELRSAEVLYAPDGFALYGRARDERERAAMKEARYVLVGRQAFWFCDVYFEPGPAWSRDDRRCERLLLIKYVTHHRWAWRLGESPLRWRIPGEIRFVPVWMDRPLSLHEVQGKGASWQPILAAVEFERTDPEWMTTFDDALGFLLDFRRAELEARIYPFTSGPNDGGRIIKISWDKLRDRKRQFQEPLRTIYFSKMRQPMGVLFEQLEGERSVPLEVFSDEQDRPVLRGGALGTVYLDRRLDDDTITVRLGDRLRHLPTRGWIRPQEDGGSTAQLSRQEVASQELRQARALLGQLHRPTGIKGIRRRWQSVGEGLSGRSPEIVKDMLTIEPFYALHGPPGTGKTTVAATAITEHLRTDRSQRILVASQSHFALDNLALKILDRCRKARLDVLAIRVASSHAVKNEKVHPRMLRLRPEALASEAIESIGAACGTALARAQLSDGRVLDDGLKALVAEWRDLAPRAELEIRDRFRRGANVVFATTGTCTPGNVATGGIGGLYDWVVIEEAARAWPTELALALVRASRWTLIGDHNQLPAHDKESVGRFLQECGRTEDDELRRHAERRVQYLEVFSLFGTLFDNRATRRAERRGATSLDEPLDELDLQFRMREPIGRLVSKTFYRSRLDPDTGQLKEYPDGWLQTDLKKTGGDHGLRRPEVVCGRALVWIDTTGVPESHDMPAWKNEGEAMLVREILARMHPYPASLSEGSDEEPLAILTPYQAQVELLLGGGLPDWAVPCIHTVDSFQGREANVVVVSMVRSTQRDSKRPESNIGYLISPNRVNVMLSRARKLQIIVGRLEHFEQQCRENPQRRDIQFWATLTAEIRRQHAVVSGSQLLAQWRVR